MKHAILFLLLAFASCQKEPTPTMSERIEGSWKQTTSPHAVYTFDGATCTRIVTVANVGVWRSEYGYTCEGDTMRLVELTTDKRQTWAVEFVTENSATIRTGGALVLNLERYP